MRSNLLIVNFLLILCSCCISAQIPNAGFEDWDANGNPVGWKATNAPPSYTTIIKTADSHSGSWAAKGDVVPFSIFTIGPSLISGEEAQGIPVNFRPAAIEGYYKFISIQDDYLQVQANFKKNGIYIGGGANNLTPANTYTKFSIANSFINADVPDSVVIAIFIASTTGLGHVGSIMYIDDLTWGSATDVNDNNVQTPNEFKLEQNYPNPFNPITKIRYAIPGLGGATHLGEGQAEAGGGGLVMLKVYDVLGNEVATLVDGYKPTGNYEIDYDASNLASGIYLYKIQTGTFVDMKKMALIK